MPLPKIRRFIENARRNRLPLSQLDQLDPLESHYYPDGTRVNVLSSKMTKTIHPTVQDDTYREQTIVKNAKVNGRKVGDIISNKYVGDHPYTRSTGVRREEIHTKTGSIARKYENGFEETTLPEDALGLPRVIHHTGEIHPNSFTGTVQHKFEGIGQDTLNPTSFYDVLPGAKAARAPKPYLPARSAASLRAVKKDNYIKNPIFDDDAYVSQDDLHSSDDIYGDPSAMVPFNRKDSVSNILAPENAEDTYLDFGDTPRTPLLQRQAAIGETTPPQEAPQSISNPTYDAAEDTYESITPETKPTDTGAAQLGASVAPGEIKPETKSLYHGIFTNKPTVKGQRVSWYDSNRRDSKSPLPPAPPELRIPEEKI